MARYEATITPYKQEGSKLERALALLDAERGIRVEWSRNSDGSFSGIVWTADMDDLANALSGFEGGVHADVCYRVPRIPRKKKTKKKRARSNPGKTSHAARAKRQIILARDHIEQSLHTGRGFEGMFNHALTAIGHAGQAYSDAEGAGGSVLLESAKSVGDAAISRAKSLVARAKKNPADIPGGNMTACMAIMEARPDVDNAGALCNWLAQRAGEYGGIRIPRGKKLKTGQRARLRKAMRG